LWFHSRLVLPTVAQVLSCQRSRVRLKSPTLTATVWRRCLEGLGHPALAQNAARSAAAIVNVAGHVSE